MEFFNSSFYQQQLKVNHNLASKKLEEIVFPQMELTVNGDKWFKKIWKSIDNAKSHCWIITYAFDSSFPAQLTLLKLIEAQKRGVNCVLFVDDLQQYVDKKLINEYQKQGGLFKSLNPTYRHIYRNIPSQEFFRRHHEKLTVIDDLAIIGSSNFQAHFGGYKYGTYDFFDMNLISQHVNLEVFRKHFQNIANIYSLKLNRYFRTNEQTVENFNAKFSDSKFFPVKFTFLKTHQPKVREIPAAVINLIENAKKKITLIHPYYYPVRSFEKAVVDALQRGVQVELITSQKRDQPCYHLLKNWNLMNNLIKNGCKVYEIGEKLLHMKAYIVDDHHYSIGSFNNDRWSWKLNNECNIFVYNDPIETKRMLDLVNDVKAYSKEIESRNVGVGPIRWVKTQFWELFLYLSEVLMSKNKYVAIEKYHYKRLFNTWDDSTSFDY